MAQSMKKDEEILQDAEKAWMDIYCIRMEKLKNAKKDFSNLFETFKGFLFLLFVFLCVILPAMFCFNPGFFPKFHYRVVLQFIGGAVIFLVFGCFCLSFFNYCYELNSKERKQIEDLDIHSYGHNFSIVPLFHL